MKRKAMMIGLAMVTGLPHAGQARSGNQDAPQVYSWNAPYMPHYGVNGAARPLMDHVSVAGPGTLPGQGIHPAWRLEFTPPPAVSNTDAPLAAAGIRAGFSLKRDF